jgi:hypothetical protein
MPDQFPPLSEAAKIAALEILALLQRAGDDEDIATQVANRVQTAITSANDTNIGVMRQIMLVLGPGKPSCEGCSAEIGEAVHLLEEAGIRYEP